ncbi:family 10 glycosylhydrolase [Microcoleus sp. FACHB-831]|uniref:glycoside hydrolase family 10 protein n=1 Tax=Microcoleus sp. FACHB-831 TaxID=2692827 RepID=UPI00168612B3|nr:family 10 glycosylhydrolase [Microcoleus sp. FACHB-831]MBD1920773.1 family 10 glycosylhydrolase [Microcoleus sp. FACHB-831]
MVSNSTAFSDIQDHWARSFITQLAQRGIFSGFPNGTFRPNQSMSRAEFAAVVSKAFTRPVKRSYVPFVDVPSSYWAAAAIKKAYQSDFISGFPDKRFRPEERITRANVLVSLVSGLEIVSDSTTDIKAQLPKLYQDAATIPQYATDKIAIASAAGLVVNYPNLKLLNPNLAATRADVAACIYQALVYLEQVPKIPSNYIVVIDKTVAVSHPRELRGVWVGNIWNSEWPSKPGLPVEQQKAELITILDRMKALNMNALMLQVRTEGDAIYASQLEPWSFWLTGTPGKAPEPFYDPLEFAIAESHKRNIELHAWFNPYRARVSTKQTPPPVSPHIAVTNPEAVYEWGTAMWMDPGLRVVQDKTYNVILNVVRRYDVDAVHLDDYFYPYPIDGKPFPDDKTYAAYQLAGGTLSLGDWRRDNINQMVQRLSKGIKAAKPYVKFGISPFGIYRVGEPAQIRGLDSYQELYSDSKKWLEQGWVDYLSPQLYWRIEPPAQSYPVLLKWWSEHNPKKRHIYVGNNLNKLDGKLWTSEEIDNQIEITRNLKAQFSLGNIFYSMEALAENRQGIYDNFKNLVYAQPALVPTMAWLNNVPPAPPASVSVSNNNITWNAASTENIRYWTLYRKNGDVWKLLKIFDGATRVATVAAGTYAICAVDRLANESGGVVVAVK